MNKVKKIVVGMSALIAVFFSVSLFAANILQVYDQAVLTDPTFRQAQANWYAARENLPIARAGYLPNVLITGSAARTFGRRRPALTPNTNGWNNTYGYQLTVNQPIFDLVAWSTIKGARDSVKSAAATYTAAVQNLIVRTTTAYFDVLKAYDKLRFTIANKNAVYQRLVTAQQKFKVGLIAITDVYDAQSVYDQAAAAEISDRNSLENALENLRAITGVHYKVLSALSDYVPFVRPRPNNINTWVHVAEQQNFSILAQRYSVLAAHDNIYQQAAGRLPTLDAQGTYQDTFTDDNNPRPSPDVRTSAASIGLELNFPVFQGGLVGASTQQARYQYLAQTALLDFTHRDVVNQTRQAFLGVASGVSKIKADLQTIKSSTNALKATRAGYVVGTRTMVDVLSDLTTVYQNKQTYADDRYNYINNYIALKAAAGTLSTNDLILVNRWLKKNVRLFAKPPKDSLALSNTADDGSSYDDSTVNKAPEPETEPKTEPSNKEPTKKMGPPKKSDASLDLKSSSEPPVSKNDQSASKATDRVNEARRYVLQFYAARTSKAAERFIRDQKEPLDFMIVKRSGWYHVVYGAYKNLDQARVALHELPAYLAKYKPWITHAVVPVSIEKTIQPVRQAEKITAKSKLDSYTTMGENTDSQTSPKDTLVMKLKNNSQTHANTNSAMSSKSNSTNNSTTQPKVDSKTASPTNSTVNPVISPKATDITAKSQTKKMPVSTAALVLPAPKAS